MLKFKKHEEDLTGPEICNCCGSAGYFTAGVRNIQDHRVDQVCIRCLNTIMQEYTEKMMLVICEHEDLDKPFLED